MKSGFKVRPCRDLDEFSRAVFAIGQYFGMDPTEERMERFSKNLPIERMHAAFEKESIVGGAGAFPFQLTVPGAVVPTAGVTVVGTFPTRLPRPLGIQIDHILVPVDASTSRFEVVELPGSYHRGVLATVRLHAGPVPLHHAETPGSSITI